MKTLFYNGGTFPMSILTLILIGMLAWAIYQFLLIAKKSNEPEKGIQSILYIRTIGLFALITGILFQLIGLYSAFHAIEEAGDISVGIVVAGLKISMISTIYGMVIYVLSLLIWFILNSTYLGKIK